MATKQLFCLLSWVGLAVVLVPRVARADCKTVLAALADRVADATCTDSTDLTTNNAATTPQNNSIANLAAGAYTPLTDRGLISPDPPHRTAIDHAVPGIQVSGRFTSDKAGQARFVLRFPADWNGGLVVAGASGTRSEHNGDFTWSDYVLQKGYAYASQNKGVWNASIVSTASPTQPATDPAACRLNPASPVWVHFFDDEPGKPFTQWTQYMLDTARLAQRAAEAHSHRRARRTYAVGTSNGGYQVRRAIEEAPDLFEVQNGNHIETFKNTFSQLEFIQPHAQRAFELLVDHVEHDAPLPPSQCIPRGGAIATTPSQPGHCAQLLVP